MVTIPEKRLIAVVGPVSPYRSGVAKHTTELVRALSDRQGVKVKVFSFSRQYPRLFFPGAHDRDPDAGCAREIEAEYSIDSLNPLTWRRAVDRMKQHGVTEVVMPAWTFFLAPSLGWIARRCRTAGIPVTMVVHNVVDHEESWWKFWLCRFQLRQASRFITHGQALAKRLEGLAGEFTITVRPHPIFEHYPDPKGELPRRAPLELLFFGLVRRYKGLDMALRGLAAAHKPGIRLTVVGEFWEGLQETHALIDSLGLKQQVELVPRFVSDAEAAEYFARADAVLLPYRAVSGSGVVPVAYRYGKPVVVTDLPGLLEVVDDQETGWVVPRDDAKALGRLLAEEVSAQSARAMAAQIARKRRQMNWSQFAEAVLEPVE